MFGILRRIRRRRLLAKPFPEEWTQLLESKLPWVRELPSDQAKRFREHLVVFVAEKHWEGAHGLEVTEAMKVLIAAGAARLSRNLPLSVYDRLISIIVYPGHYRHPDHDAIILGEANALGSVVLSWQAVLQGIRNPHDGHDTTLHEMAHVLDGGDGAFDGTPNLESREVFKSWVGVMSTQFAKLRRRPHRGVIRSYGATNAAEFFAVATEAFFESPNRLAREAPELYRELAIYYGVGPTHLRYRVPFRRPGSGVKKRKPKRRR